MRKTNKMSHKSNQGRTVQLSSKGVGDSLAASQQSLPDFWPGPKAFSVISLKLNNILQVNLSFALIECTPVSPRSLAMPQSIL